MEKNSKEYTYSQNKEQEKLILDAKKMKDEHSAYIAASGYCCSPDILIRIPGGEKRIIDIKEGDLVISDSGKAALVVKINKMPVFNHKTILVKFSDGTELEVSPLHPTACGRTFKDLTSGDLLDGKTIVSSDLVLYKHSYTYDILPDSSSGNYYANGVLIGSTLVPLVLRKAS